MLNDSLLLLMLAADRPVLTAPGRVDVALVIGVAGLIAGGVVGWVALRRRRRQQADLAELASEHGFSHVRDAESLLAIQAAMDTVFGEGAVLLTAMRKQVNGLTLEVVHYRFPMYRVERTGEWDARHQEADDRMITLVRDFDAPLPTFRLMPNNWVLNTIGGKRRNVFINVEPFGWRNYVFGTERDHIRFIFPGEIQHLLRQNKHLAIDSRRDLLAFYHLDEAWLPGNFEQFADQCLTIATTLNERCQAWETGEKDRVVYDVFGPY
ncbi:hypothetical protein ACERK3_02680 [Phycisphaerales bacterium AB-hyl4]|uniref:DUF3137 domain-containing protein n=1 Tax=Natronomicrosphaera hydrolytica TaxID=3242702 RepID=A0ABV4U0R1_9BACT